MKLPQLLPEVERPVNWASTVYTVQRLRDPRPLGRDRCEVCGLTIQVGQPYIDGPRHQRAVHAACVDRQ